MTPSLNITIFHKPYSVNKYFYGNRSIKRRETVEWELNIIECLKNVEMQSNIKEFRELFDHTKNCVKIEMVFYYPKEILLTKDNCLSSKAFDLSNVEKPLIDLLFLKKYSTNNIKNIEIDDKYIVDMRSQKKQSENSTHYIEIKIEMLNLLNL